MTDDDLTELHDRWFARLREVEASGADPDSAAESMLTVCVCSLMQQHGPRYTAGRMAVIAGMLEGLANQRANDGNTDDKTRH